MMGKASEMDLKTQALWPISFTIYCIFFMLLQGRCTQFIVMCLFCLACMLKKENVGMKTPGPLDHVHISLHHQFHPVM